MNWLAAPVFMSLVWLAWRRLEENGFGRLPAAAIITCAAVQAFACLTANAGFAALLAAGIYAVSVSALSLARERNVRGIICAGGALTVAQAIVPFAGLFTLAMLPGLIGMPRSQDERRKSQGILLLLLFMPVSADVLLTILNWHYTPASAVPSGGHLLLDALLLAVLPALTIAGMQGRRWINLIVPLSGTALLIAIAVGESMGFGYDLRVFAPASAVLLLMAISQWPVARNSARNAIVLLSAGAAVAWLPAVLP